MLKDKVFRRISELNFLWVLKESKVLQLQLILQQLQVWVSFIFLQVDTVIWNIFELALSYITKTAFKSIKEQVIRSPEIDLQCVRLVLLKSSDYFHSWIWICQSFNYIQNFTCAGSFCPMMATNLKDKLSSWFFIGLKICQFLTFVGKYIQNIRKILFKKLFLLPFPPILSVEIDI